MSYKRNITPGKNQATELPSESDKMTDLKLKRFQKRHYKYIHRNKGKNDYRNKGRYDGNVALNREFL